MFVSPVGHTWDDLLIFHALKWVGLDPARLMSPAPGWSQPRGLWIREFGDGSFVFAVNFSVSEMYLAGVSPKLVKTRLWPFPFSSRRFGTWDKPESFPTCWQLADTTRSAKLPA